MNFKVDVIIPVYNGGEFIADCLDSVLNQSYLDFRILISDNASTDNTMEILRRYESQKVVVFRQNTNIGGHENFNFLIQKTEAPLVKTFCADDVMLPWALSSQIEFFNRFPGVALCSSDMILTDKDLVPISRVCNVQGISTRELLVTDVCRTMMNSVGGPSHVMVLGDELRKHRYRPEYKYLSDLAINLEICRNGLYGNVNVPTYYYRRHAKSGTEEFCSGPVPLHDWARLLIELESDQILSVAKLMRKISDPVVSHELREYARSKFPGKMPQARVKEYVKSVLKKASEWKE